MIEYYITTQKCSIHERKTKKNGTVYDVVFRVISLDGIEKQKKLSGFSTKTLAKQAHLEFISTKCEVVKSNPTLKKNIDKKIPTVGDLIREYLTTLSNQNKESSIYDKQNIYRLFIFPRFEKVKIDTLTKAELYKWQDELWNTRNPRTKDFYSYQYLAKIRNHFNAFLNWCESRYEYKNHLAEVTKPKRRKQKQEMDFWTREEFEQFISVVDDPQYHALFTLLFFTGRRKGEIFALTPKDIKPASIIINKSVMRKTIDGSAYKIVSTKADKSQEIPISPVVQTELKLYKGEKPFFFGGKDPLPENTVTRVFQKYCKKAEVKQIRMHDLRHSFVSMLLHLGANFLVVADLIGDTVEQVTKTYAHLYEADKRNIVEKLI